MRIKHIAFGVVVMMGLLVASPAFAGIGVGVAPDFPATVVVGQTGISVGLEITNSSTPDIGSVTLSNIRLVPQCGNTDADSTTCLVAEADPGVFTVGGVGTGSNACAGRTFTIAENDATTGQVLLTPDLAIVLAQGATCRIDFTVDVSGVPTNDAIAGAGLQTLQIGKVVAATSTLEGNGLGTDITTVDRVTPTVTTLLSTTSAAVGTAVTDSATLTGATADAGGSASYTVFSDTGCSVGAQSAGTKVVTNALIPDSDPLVFNTPGTFYWQVVYSGDANNNAATSTCTEEIVTIVQAPGRIIVDKVTDPSGDPQSFDFTTTGSGYAPFALTDAAAPNEQELAAGTYEVSEVVPADWSLSSVSCLSGGSATGTPSASGVSIDLEPGEIVTCTFTNTETGRIIVDKVTDPSGDPQSFGFTATGTGYTNFSLTDAAAPNDQALAAGTYGVSEDAVAGWVATSAACTSSLGGSEDPANIALTAGETVTCVFTNTKNGRLIVDKITNPAGSLVEFPVLASGTGAITGGGAGTTTDAISEEYEVAPGTYSVVETVPAGWTQDSNTCSGVAVAAGETVTCVITNSQTVAQYCSPGYWRQSQHFDSYPSPYTSATLFGSVFSDAFPGMTLQQVVSNGGGGLAAFGRATVAALLNAGSLTTATTTSGVISTFNSVFANAPTGKAANSYYSGAQSLFPSVENCPLN